MTSDVTTPQQDRAAPRTVYLVINTQAGGDDYEAYQTKKAADKRAAGINRQARLDDDADAHAEVWPLEVTR